MNNVLKKIIDKKHEEIAQLKKIAGQLANVKRTDTKRPFINSLNRLPQLAVIAEVKKGSPSKGVICENFDPVKIAESYERGGAAAISVLTDEQFFMGHLDYLKMVRAAVSLPVLRKDFIVDILQVQQTASINADAMLLIAACLDDAQMQDLYSAAMSYDLDPLIEVHNINELERVMKLSPMPKVIGINNRNLDTFVTDIAVTVELIKNIPSDITVVSESGIFTGDDALRVKDVGVKTLLVGESLMRAGDNVGELLKEFF